MLLDDFTIPAGSTFDQSEEAPKNVGGRPHIQRDNFLEGSFDFLIGGLEENWARVGWALVRIREAPELQTLEAVRYAFEPIKQLAQRVVCLLSEDTVAIADAKQLGDLRKQFDEAVRARSKAREAYDRQFDRWREARQALLLATPELMAFVMAEKDKRKSELFGLRDTLRAREKEMSDVEKELEAKEAFFAQNEALDFLRQRRYELDPRNLAAALADLPYTHWETSVTRCQKIGCARGEHVYYSVFRAISYLTKDVRPQTTKEAQLFFREAIPKLPESDKQDHKQGKKFLVHHWFQLKRAIEQEWDRCPNPRRLPFVLTVAFVGELARPLTVLDRMLAAEEKLEI